MLLNSFFYKGGKFKFVYFKNEGQRILSSTRVQNLALSCQSNIYVENEKGNFKET